MRSVKLLNDIKIWFRAGKKAVCSCDFIFKMTTLSEWPLKYPSTTQHAIWQLAFHATFYKKKSVCSATSIDVIDASAVCSHQILKTFYLTLLPHCKYAFKAICITLPFAFVNYVAEEQLLPSNIPLFLFLFLFIVAVIIFP